MTRTYPQLTFTESVKAVQDRYGTRAITRRMETQDFDDARIGAREASFIETLDGFYVASVGETGRPYVQFRGGPRGFLKVIDERTLAWADFRGNLQYITTGNVAHDDRVSLILMDYANRRRLKIMARARVVHASDDPGLVARVADDDYEAKVERAVVLTLEAFDWNCPQHITPRFTAEEWRAIEASTA